MKENKLSTISYLFEGKEIRSIWNGEKDDYYFSVVDVIGTNSRKVMSRLLFLRILYMYVIKFQ